MYTPNDVTFFVKHKLKNQHNSTLTTHDAKCKTE